MSEPQRDRYLAAVDSVSVSGAGRVRSLAIVAIAGGFAVAGLVGTHVLVKSDAESSQRITTVVHVSQPATATATVVRTTVPVTPTRKTNDPAYSAITVEKPLIRAKCDLPQWVSGDKQFLTAALKCLNDAWRPMMTSLNIPFTEPRLDISSNPETCRGAVEGNSFYCGGMIHLDPTSYQRTGAGPAAVAIAALSMLSHEYGHHIQHLSGTLDAALDRISAAGPHSPRGLELTRRTEMQAECLDGIFLGATFDEVTVDVAKRDAYTRGDPPSGPRDHGSPDHFGGWLSVGADLNSLAVCNTWTAPADAVS